MSAIHELFIDGVTCTQSHIDYYSLLDDIVTCATVATFKRKLSSTDLSRFV